MPSREVCPCMCEQQADRVGKPYHACEHGMSYTFPLVSGCGWDLVARQEDCSLTFVQAGTTAARIRRDLLPVTEPNE